MTGPPSAGAALRIGGQVFDASRPAVMAIINRTNDSFFEGARHADDDVAAASVAAAQAQGADIVDIGGIKAAPGEEISAAEEIDRVIPFVKWVRDNHPELLISVDTWRAEVGRAACEAGAHVLNDTWAGADPELATVAATYGAGLVCSHTGGQQPRTRPHRVAYGSSPRHVVGDVIVGVTRLARAAEDAGVPPERILVDPTHDFGKNTWHGLTLLRHTDELAATGYPVLMALSRKDFIGETLNAPVAERLAGSLAATAIACWLGARVVRAHDVQATRHAVDMAASIRGERPPALVVRGLA